MPQNDNLTPLRDWLLRLEAHRGKLTFTYGIIWSLLWLDAHAFFQLSLLTLAFGFATALPVCYYWIRRHRHSSKIVRRQSLNPVSASTMVGRSVTLDICLAL